MKNNSKEPLSWAHDKPCPVPHVDIVRYEKLILFLVNELERGLYRPVALQDEALIECMIVKHTELTSGQTIWTPSLKKYVPFDEFTHGSFAVLRQKGPVYIRYTTDLLPTYCKLCFLSDCHEQAACTTQALLHKFESYAKTQREPGLVLAFEIRTLEYLLYNISAKPHSVVGEIVQSPDVTVDIKVTVDLLWSHLVLVYAGKRRLLFYNLDCFFCNTQESNTLCPDDLRSALFVHGKHEPVSKREDRARRRRNRCFASCPVVKQRAVCRQQPTNVGGYSLFESRTARFCWLAALWSLDFACNRQALRWLYKPETLGRSDKLRI